MAQTKLNNAQLPDTIQNKTIDTSNDIDTTTTKLTISGGSNGQVLSTDGSGNLSWATAGGGGGLGAPTYELIKTADETITNSTTLQDDDHLYQALISGKTYWIELSLILSKGDASNNLNPKFAIAGNSEGYFSQLTIPVGLTLMDGTTAVVITSFISANIVSRLQFSGAVKLTSNTTLQLKWAQNVSNSTPHTLHKGSRLTIWEVA